MEKIKSAVYYSDFGAVGDGVTNDFEALYNAHIYANENKLPVFGENGKTYYIETTEKDGVARSIPIQTDTDWCGAHFIIDDTNIKHIPSKTPRNSAINIFTVCSHIPTLRIEGEALSKLGKIGPNTTKIDLGLGYPAMLIIYNENRRVYIRNGFGCTNSGNPQQELVVVDKDGNVDKTTSLLLDYDEISYIDVIRDDIEPLTIQNAEFTCLASRVNILTKLEDGTVKKCSAYFRRGMGISRSHTHVKNIKHFVKGEFTVEEQAQGFSGPPYRGFFAASMANDVLIENCVITARRNYAPGTYAIGAGLTNQFVCKNCVQSNFYMPGTKRLSMEISPLTGKLEYWGVGGSNYSKNMVFDSCLLNRFDAHAGLYNGKIINSRVSMVNLIGGGDMLIENTVFELSNATIINLRADYGSTWNGTVTIRNCKVEPNNEVTKKTELRLVGQYWLNHYFGYTCYSPNLIVDNLEIVGEELPIHVTNWINRGNPGELNVYTEKLLCEPITSEGVPNENQVIPPKFIKIINNHAGHSYDIVDVPMFRDTEIIGAIKVNPEEA